MNSEQFCYWMSGFIELNEAHLQSVLPTESQWDMIKEHLSTVFNKITPPIKPVPTKQVVVSDYFPDLRPPIITETPIFNKFPQQHSYFITDGPPYPSILTC